MNSQYVTFSWLIGTGIAITSIFIAIFYKAFANKVDTKLCNERHRVVEDRLSKVDDALTNQMSKLEEIRETVIRIETILNSK